MFIKKIHMGVQCQYINFVQISVQSMKSEDRYYGRSRYHKSHQYSVGIVVAITFVEEEWYVIK